MLNADSTTGNAIPRRDSLWSITIKVKNEGKVVLLQYTYGNDLSKM